MVINKKYNTDFASTWEIFGDSTEVKPTTATVASEKDLVPDHSIFVELDTGDGYYYDKATDTWIIIG